MARSSHIKHEKLPKEARPDKGETYTIAHNGRELYRAEVIKYGGGCWATVKIVDPLTMAGDPAFNAGTQFDLRVAMYDFLPA